jgi:hypothetical protein
MQGLRCSLIDYFLLSWYLILNITLAEVKMKILLTAGLLLVAASTAAAVTVGSPDIPSMDPFCAS